MYAGWVSRNCAWGVQFAAQVRTNKADVSGITSNHLRTQHSAELKALLEPGGTYICDTTVDSHSGNERDGALDRR